MLVALLDNIIRVCLVGVKSWWMENKGEKIVEVVVWLGEEGWEKISGIWVFFLRVYQNSVSLTWRDYREKTRSFPCCFWTNILPTKLDVWTFRLFKILFGVCGSFSQRFQFPSYSSFFILFLFLFFWVLIYVSFLICYGRGFFIYLFI